jgi:hypothetical protein
MKKLLSIFLISLCIVFNANALVLSNSLPSNGAVLKGDGTDVFSVDGDVPMTSSMLWIHNTTVWRQFPGVCAGTTCSVTPNLSGWLDLTTYQKYWVVDGSNSPPFPSVDLFSINRVPQTPTVLTCAGLTENTLRLSWSDNLEVDFSNYELERNGSIIYSGAINTLDDSSLLLGVEYVYRVRSIDTIAQTSGWSGSVSCAPMDMTPPDEPIVNPINGATVNTNNFNVQIDYNENVQVTIKSGASVVQNLGVCQNCVWNLVLPFEGTFNYVIEAKDSYNNTRNTNWRVTYDDGAVVNMSGKVVGVPFFKEPVYTILRGEDSNNGNGYWTIGVQLSYYGYNNIRPTMTDVFNSLNVSVAQVSEEVTPTFYCNYDSVLQNWDGTGYRYFMDNLPTVFTPIDNQCVDVDPSDVTTINGYITIPVKQGLSYGLYHWNVGWDASLI